MRVVLDSDILAYSCGFAVEKTVYDYITQDGEHGIATIREEIPEGAEFETIKEVEPWANAKYLVEKAIEGVRTEVERRIGREYDLVLYLTGTGNFRESVATIRGYKANREGMPKPHWYAAIRQHLVEDYGAIVVNGYEADDAVAMEAYAAGYDPNRCIIVSADKDLMNVPALIFNLKRKQWYDVSVKDAQVNFYRQLLSGDSVDNIAGCYKVGKGGAEKKILPYMTEEAMYSICLNEYKLSTEKAECPYKDQDPEKVLLENANLLHLWRFPGDYWKPPHLRDTAPTSSGTLGEPSASELSTKQSGSISTSQKQAADAGPAEQKTSSVGRSTSRTSRSARTSSSKRKAS